MADLTTRRRPLSDQSAELKQRRLEVQAHTLKGEIMKTELSVLEYEQIIIERQASITTLREQLGNIESQLVTGEEVEQSE